MKNIIILFGGDSFENNISIVTAKNIAENLGIKYKYYLIDISNKGWQIYLGKLDYFINEVYRQQCVDVSFIFDKGKPAIYYDRKIVNIDFCINAIHGKNGEDGNIQGFLEICNIPYVGTSILGSINCFNKRFFKIIMDFYQIPQLKWKYCKLEDKDIYINFDYPIIVKPETGGSSLGISICHEKSQLKFALIEAAKYDENILIEEFKSVREIDCSLLCTNSIQVLSLSENIYNEEFFSYKAKYESNDTDIIIPAKLSNRCKETINDIVLKIVDIFHLKGLVRVDFFVDKKENVYINEVNTQPGIGADESDNIWKYHGSLSFLLEKIIDNND